MGYPGLPETLRILPALNLGEVIEKAYGTVCRDGMNIATRLEGLDEPGAADTG